MATSGGQQNRRSLPGQAAHQCANVVDQTERRSSRDSSVRRYTNSTVAISAVFRRHAYCLGRAVEWWHGVAFLLVSTAGRTAMAEQPPGVAHSTAARDGERQGFYGRITMGAGLLHLVVEGHDPTGASLSATGLHQNNDL